MRTYKSLDAWKRSMELVEDIYKLTKLFPKEELYGLTSQVKRAAISIPSNIAEGSGRNYRKDSIQFFHISRGSLYELDTLISIAFSIGALPKEKLAEILLTIENCIKMVNGLIKYFESADLK